MKPLSYYKNQLSLKGVNGTIKIFQNDNVIEIVIPDKRVKIGRLKSYFNDLVRGEGMAIVSREPIYREITVNCHRGG